VAFGLIVCGTTTAAADKPPRVLRMITGKVVAIADGDELTVFGDAKVQHRMRLHGIDVPANPAQSPWRFSRASRSTANRASHHATSSSNPFGPALFKRDAAHRS